MRRFHRLTLGERYQIQALLDSGRSFRFIARQLGRSASTICREVGKPFRRYDALDAEEKTLCMRHRPHPDRHKIRGRLKSYIENRVRCDWSPEQIAGRLRRDLGRSVVSYQTIYRHIQRDQAGQGNLWRHLRILRRQRKDRKKPSWHPERHLRARVMIDRRPKLVDQRSRLGDVERDTVFGKANGSMLLTIVDRRSRFLKLRWVAKKSSDLVHQATVEALKGEVVRTITNDNGTEFARHQETARALEAKVYFSKAYRSWERGTNENTNGLLRQYFPRKRDLGKPSKVKLQAIEDRINNRPKKCLGYQTPSEVHRALKRQALR